MPQCTFYRNKNPNSRTNIPYLLDVQSDLLSTLATRVVIPLFHQQRLPIQPLARLMPVFHIHGEAHVLMTPQLAGIAIKDLGDPAGDLLQYRQEIIAAIDLLITGF